MLKKPATGVLETREAYLVKRRSFPDSDVSRFTFHERRDFAGNGTVSTGQPAVRTTFSAVLPKKILSTLPERPP
jgi:hypothetical protein